VSSFLEIPVELLVLGLRLLFIAAIYGFLFMVIREIHKDWQRAPRSTRSLFGLVVISSGSESIPVGERFALSSRSTIGRVAGATIRLDDEHVSANHAEVSRGSNGAWLLRDAGSTNGTRLNGQQISGQVQMHTGDLVELGTVALRLELLDG
jgi:FHA domain-containing protein